MWINWFTTDGVVRGRVNLGHLVSFDTIQAGSNWFIQAAGVDGVIYKVSEEIYASRVDAINAVDDLILNGS